MLCTFRVNVTVTEFIQLSLPDENNQIKWQNLNLLLSGSQKANNCSLLVLNKDVI